MEPDAVEIRVLGCLLEKQRTTPDAYPLSLNALRQACNQASNRDPVVSYEEEEIGDALRRLTLRGWVRLSGDAGSRVRKYRHLLAETLDLDSAELSLLAVLLLRGVQTQGELKQRSERLYAFEDLRGVHEVLERLVERGLVVRHERRRGQKEDRYEQRLGSEGVDSQAEVEEGSREQVDGQVEPVDREERAPVAEKPAEELEEESPAKGSVEARVEWLEAEVVKLRAQLASLKKALGE